MSFLFHPYRTAWPVACLLIAFGCGLVHGRTIYVERDGSGDYATIQPALDAAAPGDTVRIGPGQYTELNTYYLPGNGEWVEVGAYVRVDNLTIIGSGTESTVIGSDTYIGHSYSPKGLVYLEPGTVRVEGIKFTNYFDGVFVIDARLYVYDCNFDNNGDGIAWYSIASGGGFSILIFGQISLGMDFGWLATGETLWWRDVLLTAAGLKYRAFRILF